MFLGLRLLQMYIVAFVACLLAKGAIVGRTIYDYQLYSLPARLKWKKTAPTVEEVRQSEILKIKND